MYQRKVHILKYIYIREPSFLSFHTTWDSDDQCSLKSLCSNEVDLVAKKPLACRPKKANPRRMSSLDPKPKAFSASKLWSTLHSVRRQPLICFANTQLPLLNSQSLQASSFWSKHQDDHGRVALAMVASDQQLEHVWQWQWWRRWQWWKWWYRQWWHRNGNVDHGNSCVWPALWSPVASLGSCHYNHCHHHHHHHHLSSSIGNGCVWPVLSDHVWPPLAAS